MKLQYNDKQHSYYLDGTRCKSVTAIAKIPDDTYALDNWRKRMVALGMAMSPPLVERAAAHYDDRDQLDAIAEEAMQAAKAHEAAGRGTAAHRITERIDLGQMVVDTPLSRAITDAWKQALQQADLEIIPELCERIVVYPEQKVCGKFDRIVRHRPTGRLHILDVKTGEGAVRYPHAIAVQEALYANAPLLAGPLDRRGVTEEFGPLPELDCSVGFVVHMPASGTVEVLEVDILRGWDCVVNVVFPTLKWRKRDDLIRPISAVPVTEPLALTPEVFEPTAWDLSQDAPGRLQTPDGSLRLRDTTLPRTPGAVVDNRPAPAFPNEGQAVSTADVEALRAAVAALPAERKAWVKARAEEAAAAGYSLNLGFGATQRRWAIATALLHLARMDASNLSDLDAFAHEVTTALLGVPFLLASLGQALAHLTIAEATRLADMARAAQAPAVA